MCAALRYVYYDEKQLGDRDIYYVIVSPTMTQRGDISPN